MLVSGTDDLNIPTDFTVKFIVDRLKENGKEHLCTNLRYPHAGHLIEPPYSPLCDSSFNKSTKEWCGDAYLAWGGETVHMPEHKRTLGQRSYTFCENIFSKTKGVRIKNT